MAAGGQVRGGGEVGAVAGLGGLAGQPDGQMGLAGAGRADEQDVGGRFEVAAGGEFLDQRVVDGGLGVVVELLQGGRGGQRGEPQPTGQAAGLGGVDFEGEQAFQGGGQRQLSAAARSSTAGRCSAAVCSLSAARWPRSCW